MKSRSSANRFRVAAVLGALAASACPGAAHAAVPPQLNVSGFAYCLAQEAPRVDLGAEARDNGFSATDGLLLYLSVYPGKRFPAPIGNLQESAHERWAVALEPRERQLAASLAARLGEAPESVAPAPFFGEALGACDGGVFCAALISHNVLRTLGRHAQAIYQDPLTGATRDLNPAWFTDDREAWLGRIPGLQPLLLNLRPDHGGDGWGEWYHFFGVLAFAIHELALHSPAAGIGNVEIVVRLNELLNPLLAGGPESPEKARLDRDSVAVDWSFVSGEGRSPAGSCDDRASYVAF
jgi:hypothetical protein